MKPVCVIVPSLLGGGAEKMALKLATSIQSSTGAPTHLINMERGTRYEVPATIQRHVLSAVDGKATPWKKILAFPWQWLRFQLLIVRLRPELVVSFTSRANLLSMSSFLRSRTRIISYRNYMSLHMHVRSGIWGAIRRVCYTALLRSAHRLVRAIVVVTKEAKQDLVQNFGVPAECVQVAYNFYDVADLQSSAQAALPSAWEAVFAEPTVVCVGRFMPQKGFDRFLPVFQQAKIHHPSLRLIFVGEGAEHASLRTQARALNLRVSEGPSSDADVIFAGFQSNPHQFVARATVFAFPSLWEGFPSALLEAMASGAAIVSSDCPSGPKEIFALPDLSPLRAPVQTAYGYVAPCLYDPHAPEASARADEWCAALDTLLADTTQRESMSRAAQQRAEDFNVHAQGDAWKKIIAESLGHS